MALLELNDVRKSYGSVTAVNGASFTVKEGSFHSVIGPNGAGKTTLFNLISGELPVTGGTIRFRGAEIQGLPPYKIARLGVGRSFQRTNLFWDLSVFENVRLGAQGVARGSMDFLGSEDSLGGATDRSREVLEEVGLAAQANRKASELAHGDQRILELAITLATKPSLLLLDEPTSGMSKEETLRMIALVKKLGGQHTVLLIEHNMRVVMTVSDRITVLHYGEVLVDGTPDEVRKNEAVRKAYLGGRR